MAVSQAENTAADTSLNSADSHSASVSSPDSKLDLLSAFALDNGFGIQVDNHHACRSGVFIRPIAASDAATTRYPLINDVVRRS